ncbi:MAG: ABC transporter substrate-binding protein [Actinomycetota bacterium]|nr:ABC transporter substrate-binding protein [Actinomycetota bacterium]
MVAMLAASACAASEREEPGPEGGEASGGTLVFGAAGDPKVLDPTFASDGETFRVLRQIYEGLLTSEEGSAELVPALAADFPEISEDGLTYTFPLREGVTFHDGTEFNAEAVCFNFDRWYNFTGTAQNPGVTPYWQDVFGGFADTPDTPNIFESCSVEDDLTAVIQLTTVTSRFPAALALPSFSMSSPTALQEYDADNVTGEGDAPTYPEYATEHPTGTGPFMFESWDRANGQITITRFDDYWGEPAGLDEVIFRTIPDGNTRKQELEAGSIDGYDLVAPGDIEDLESQGFNVLTRDAFNILYLGINQGQFEGAEAAGINPALADIRVRQAIAHAIDRESIVTSQLPDGAEVATQFMPDTVDGWSDAVTEYPYDPDLARQLLEEAGATGTTLKFYYPTDVSRPYMPDPASIFQVISQNLQDVGFVIEPTALTWNPDYLEATANGLADIHLLGWTGDYNDAYNFIGTFFDAKAGGVAKLDFGGYDNQELFDAFRVADSEPDSANRVALYEDLSEMIVDFLPAVPISHSPPALVIAENVEGLVPSPLTSEDFSTVTLTD